MSKRWKDNFLVKIWPRFVHSSNFSRKFKKSQKLFSLHFVFLETSENWRNILISIKNSKFEIGTKNNGIFFFSFLKQKSTFSFFVSSFVPVKISFSFRYRSDSTALDLFRCLCLRVINHWIFWLLKIYYYFLDVLAHAWLAFFQDTTCLVEFSR